MGRRSIAKQAQVRYRAPFAASPSPFSAAAFFSTPRADFSPLGRPRSVSTQLQFQPSFGATAIYLAQHALTPPEPAGEALLAPLRPAAEGVNACLKALGLEPEWAWHRLLTAAAQWESNVELVSGFLRRAVGASGHNPAIASRLVAEVSSLEAALDRAAPDLAKELSLRIGPLRDQWEARGPGVMRRLARTTDPALPPEQATVAIVAPLKGGGGTALLASNTVVMEGVLTNGDPQLPEVLRLAWLVAQLNLDLPQFSEEISPPRLLQLAPLALLPPILEAGEYVELIEPSPTRLARAIDSWTPRLGPSAEVADILAHWWEAHLEHSVPWRIALSGLDRLLDGPSRA